MSAPEPTTAAPVEEVKPMDTTPAVETSKVEEPAAVAEVAAPAVEATPATDAEPAATEEPPKEEAKPEVKEAGSKSTLFSKFLGALKVGGEKKMKVPKSPKKEKKEEDTPAAEGAPKTETPAVEVTEPPKEEPLKDDVTPVTQPTEDTETAAAAVPAAVPVEAKEEKAKEEKPAAAKAELKALKVGRRLSARVGDLFKSKPKSEVATPAKVDENPPMIDEPEPVAPLENPASEAVPEAKVEESVKPAEVTTPVIAATA